MVLSNFVENFLRFFKDFPGNFVRRFINGFNKDLFRTSDARRWWIRGIKHDKQWQFRKILW